MKTFLPVAALALAAVLGIAAPTRAADTAKPADDGFSSLTEIAAVLPHEIQVGLMNNAGRDAAATNATEVLHQKAVGKTATLKLRIESIERDLKPDTTKDAYRIKTVDEHTRAGAVRFRDIVWIHFDMSENAKIAAMNKGAEITVTGKITRAELTVPPRSVDFHVDVSDAVVK